MTSTEACEQCTCKHEYFVFFASASPFLLGGGGGVARRPTAEIIIRVDFLNVGPKSCFLLLLLMMMLSMFARYCHLPSRCQS